MVKKAIHHFSRGLIVGLEVSGVIALLGVLAWIGLMARLAQGPINADFLTGYLYKEINEQQNGFSFTIGSTELTTHGRFKPVEIQLNRVLVTRSDKTPVLSVDRVNVRLSKRQLVLGRLVPRVIEIHGPALRVIRWEDGHFTLNLGAPPEQAGGAPAANPAGADLIHGLLDELQKRELPFLGGLREIKITDASAFYDDRIMHAALRGRDANVTFRRSRNGIESESSFLFDLDDMHKASLRINAAYDWDTHTTEVMTAFSNFVPALALKDSEGPLKEYVGINLPLKGSLALRFDDGFMPVQSRFVLSSDPGTFSGLGLFPTPVPVKELYVNGHLDLKTLEGNIEKLRLDLGGPRLEATVASTRIDNETRVRAEGTLVDMPIDDLNIWWPEKLAVSARSWVTKHLSKGVAHKATLDLELGLLPENKVALRKVGGRIDFTGIKVDYFPPLMPVLGVDGVATYDHKSFSLDLTSGTLGDMKVSKSAIRITDLDIATDHVHSKIDIATSLRGPLKTALKVVDSKPLEYAKDVGVETSEVGGNADLDVTFKFPLYENLKVEEVQAGAKATLDDVLLKNMVAGMPLSGGPMQLTVTNGALNVSGKGRIGDMPVTFDWLRNFPKNAKIRQKVDAQLSLTAGALKDFGVPADLNVGGVLPADVSYTLNNDGSGLLKLKGELRETSFEVPLAGFKKSAGTPGAVSLTLHTMNGKPRGIDNLDLRAGDAVLKGGLDFDDGGVKKVSFTNVLLGATDVSLAANRDGAGAYTVKVTGKQLDLSDMLKADNTPGNDAEANKKSPPLSATLDVGRILTGKDKFVDKAKIAIQRNAWRRIERLEMSGVTGGGALSVRYVPVANGHALHLEAAYAGAALSALGFTNGIKRGTLVIDAKPAPGGGPRDLAGQAVLRDFVLNDVPLLGRLLNALSLPGIFDLLNGQGIAFHKAKTEFFWTDRGMPGSQKNARALMLKDGETSGASLGLTFEGHIDEWTKVYDLNGTIIPVSDVNKMVASIPLVGTILSGGSDGVFAATYVIKGPKSDPSVIVNPISVLAPGIIRKLFFEK